MSLKPNSEKKLRKTRNKLKATTAEEYDAIEKKLLKDMFRNEEGIVGQVRITAGQAKNVKLDIPKKTRPLTDRMKTQIFDALEKDIYRRTVLDLYAGSGSFGLEALSRGASSATFVDASKQAEKILEQNVRRTGFLLEAKVVREKAIDFVNRSISEDDLYEVIFIDPPYKQFKRKDKNQISILLDQVEKLLPGISKPEDKKLFKGVVILKHPRKFDLKSLTLNNLKIFETYTYGINGITLLIIDYKKH